MYVGKERGQLHQCIVGMTTGSAAACRSIPPPRISRGEGEIRGGGLITVLPCLITVLLVATVCITVSPHPGHHRTRPSARNIPEVRPPSSPPPSLHTTLHPHLQ